MPSIQLGEGKKGKVKKVKKIGAVMLQLVGATFVVGVFWWTMLLWCSAPEDAEILTMETAVRAKEAITEYALTIYWLGR